MSVRTAKNGSAVWGSLVAQVEKEYPFHDIFCLCIHFTDCKSQKTNRKKKSGSPCSTKFLSCLDTLSYVLMLIILNYKVHFFHL